ncbi:MAG: TasA family protein [Candidatus Buchananbacteria bacterium]|jgi:predicted ribosomally synthesized peptide with SipW-like signal peptide
MKRIVISLAVIALVAAAAIGVTRAYFSDVETTTGNTFAAGSLDLEIGASSTVPFNVSDIKPGDSGSRKIELTNTGSLPGKLNVGFINFQQAENGILEPELHPGWGTADYENGPNAGELNFFLGFLAFVDVDKDGVFDVGVDQQLDIQLAYNGQQMPFPGFWQGDFHYAPMSSNLTPWNNIMTLAPNQSVDVVIMYNFPGAQTVGDGNYSQNIAMTDGLSFDIQTSLTQVQ